MIGRWWKLFIISLSLTFSGLIIIIYSNYSLVGSYCHVEKLPDGRSCYNYYSNSHSYDMYSECIIPDCYAKSLTSNHIFLSGLIITSLAGFFFLLSSCVLSMNSLNIPIPIPRVSLEWRQPEINETNIRNSNVAATVPATSENIETIYLDALESANQIKEV